jgi:diacylglycerol kinase family enzyme
VRCGAGDDGDPARLAAIVLNPVRVRDVPQLRLACVRACTASGWAPPEFLVTTPEDAGSAVTAAAVRAGASLVLAVGGDGTVRACAQSLAGTGVPLSIVPNGCANLTAKALGIPGDLESAIAVGLHGDPHSIDLADADGMTCVAMAGIGLDAAVVGAAPALLKRHAGWLGYAAAAVPKLIGPPARFTVAMDGQPARLLVAHTVAVGNLGLLPGGFELLPDARMDDGMLDVAILAPAGLAGWASIGVRVALRSRRDDGQLQRCQAREIEISSDADLPRQVDGELSAPGRSLRVVVRPGALRVMVPRRRAAAAA